LTILAISFEKRIRKDVEDDMTHELRSVI